MMIWIIWGLIAVGYYLITLWVFLEAQRKKLRMAETIDTFKQAVFVTVCVALSIAADHFFLPTIDELYFKGSDGIHIIRFLLFPFILVTAATILGGSTPIRISKAPRLARKDRRHIHSGR